MFSEKKRGLRSTKYSRKTKNEKKTSTWVFLYKKYNKFKSFSLEQFVECKTLTSEECGFFFQSENRCLYRYITYLLLEPSPRGMFGVLCILVLLHPT